MSIGLVLGVVAALAYAFLNGVNDAATSVAMPVVTRVARPAHAVVLAAIANFVGPLLLGTAVVETVAGLVDLDGPDGVAVVGAGLSGAAAWCLFGWWRGLPTSAGHALVGGLAGAGVAAGGITGVNWGGLSGGRPVGVVGVLSALVVSVLAGLVVGGVVDRMARRALRRATTAIDPVVGVGEWMSAAALAVAHGANDGAKSIGAIAAILFAAGEQTSVAAPRWANLTVAVALTAGTALGGWSIVRTVGRRLVRMRSLDGVVAEGSSAGVVLASTAFGAPVSTTQVLASSVVGAGIGHGRFRHVGWGVAGRIVASWFLTVPAAALVAASLVPLWRWIS